MIVSTSHRVCTMKNIDFTDFFNVFLSGATITGGFYKAGEQLPDGTVAEVEGVYLAQHGAEEGSTVYGANWTYVLWELYAAFFVCLESFLLLLLNQAAEKYGINLENPMIVLCRRLLMFFVFIPAALLFRAQSIGQVGEIITVLASGTPSVSAGLDALGLNGYSLMTLLLIIVTMNRLHVWSVFDLPAVANASVTARRDAGMVLMTLAVILSWLALLATQNAAGFAYFQF